MHFLDSYFMWNVLRKEINSSSNNVNADDKIDESDIQLLKFLLKSLIFNPLNPISDEGIMPYSCFEISNMNNKHKNFMVRATQVTLNTILHYRPYYHNLLSYYTLNRNNMCGAILKLVSCKVKNSSLPTKLYEKLLTLATNRLVFIQHNANFIYLAIELLI